MNRPTLICIAEDRPGELVAIKLLLLSLVKHCPNIQVILTFPPATPDFKRWVAQFQNQVELRTEAIPGAYGWNVKPQALLSLFEEGHDEIWWIDSDILLTRDFRAGSTLPENTFLACEEALYAPSRWDNGKRAQAWNFEIGRTFDSVFNSGVLRVTRSHVPLLQKWKVLLENDAYKQEQQKPYARRPIQAASDQDVLTALLSSTEFSNISIKRLSRGKDIIQYFGPAGYTLKERFHNLLFGLPPFIHAQGIKPWRSPSKQELQVGLRRYYVPLLIALSPYNLVAARYRQDLDETTTFLDTTSGLGNVLKALALGNPCLAGLPLSVAYSTLKLIRQS